MKDTLTNLAGLVIRAAGWENVILGLGGAKDPSTYTKFAAGKILANDWQLLESIYVDDALAGRIIDALPSATLRAGWDLALPGDPAQAQRARDLYVAREKQLGVPTEMGQGSAWGRLFGGGVTWVGADDGLAPDQPLNEANIASVRFLHTFDRMDVQVWKYYQDPKHPKFRSASHFRITPRVVHAGGDATGAMLPPGIAGGVVVHESRCIVWRGQPTTNLRRLELGGWDDTILQRCWDPLRQLAEDFGASSSLLGRVSQSVYKIKELYAMIAGKQEAVLQARMSMLDASRSRARAIVLDTDEEFVNVTQPLSGVPELLDKAILRLAAAVPMPVTVLMGQPMTGLNTTGQGDLEVWEQQCGSWRTTDFAPQHRRIAELILLAKDGPVAGAPPDHWKIAYKSFRTPSRKERAEIRKIEAETDAINVDKGVYPAEVAAFRYGPDGETSGIVLDEKELAANLERRKELAKQPPKDNAELGTVGARTSAVLEVVSSVVTKKIPRESGITILTELHRYKTETATAMLGPENFEPAVVEPPKPPGPPPAPPGAGGAGRPPALPGVDDGGDPAKLTPSVGSGG